MVRRILIFVIFWAVSIGVKSQYDPQFSQNMFNMMTVNPAYAGTDNAINLVALNRNQWRGDYAIKTTVFSGHMPVSLMGNSSGVGISFMNDEIGFFTNLTMSLNYAYHLELAKGSLSMGLSIGLINQKFDGSGIYFPSEGGVYVPDDPAITNAEVNGSGFDAGFGIFYQTAKYYGGVSLSHLTKPEPNFKGEFNFSVARTLFITGGYNFKLEDTLYEILPSVFFKTDGASSQIDINTLVRYKQRYWGGLTYRLQDAIVILGGLEMKNGVRFGYSYDITTSGVATAGKGGTHEVMVGYDFDLSFEKRTKRYKSVRYL